MRGATAISDPELLRWLDARAVPDEAMAEAYESLGGPARGSLKKGIARIHAIYGELPERGRTTRTFRQGFGLETDAVPADWVLAACDPDYPSPSALVAAIMPALLAGANTLFPCFPSAPAPALLAALELAGVEQSFVVPEREMVELAGTLHDVTPKGRIIALGSAGFAEALISEAHHRGIPCLSLTLPLTYFNARLERAATQRFLPGTGWSAHVPQELGDKSDRGERPHCKAGVRVCPDDSGNAVAGSGESPSDESRLVLHLDAEHEDVWIWPDLPPDWFLCRRMRLFTTS